MWFPVAIIASTLVTLTSIFAVYKVFLDKPLPPQPPPGQQIVNFTPLPTVTPVIQSTPTPTNPEQRSSAKNSTKPKASVSKTSTIGTLTVLQNSTSSNTTSNSTSSQTNSSSTISGTISLSGTIPSDTSIVIVARESGSSYQTVVSGISTTNGATWTWSTAQKDKVYNMMAILKGSSGGVNTDYATSQAYTVTAPASLQTFTINAASPMSTPTGSITTTCTTQNSNNTWYAAVNFPTISGGQMYQLQIGTTSGASDLVNTTQAAQSTTNQTVSATLTDSVNYYAQYAVAGVPYPTSYQYSAFSTPMAIKCP